MCLGEFNCDKYPCSKEGTQQCKEDAGDERTCVCKTGYFGDTCNQSKGEAILSVSWFYSIKAFSYWDGLSVQIVFSLHQIKPIQGENQVLMRLN